MSEFLEKVLTSTATWIITGVLGPIILASLPKLRTWLFEKNAPARIAVFSSIFASMVASGVVWTLVRSDLALSEGKNLVAIEAAGEGVRLLKSDLLVWASEPATPGNAVGGGDAKPATMCPDGYYAAGINTWGSPGSTKYCIGCLNGIQVVCRRLKVK